MKKVVKIQIGKGVLCYNLPNRAKLKIRKDLSFVNPEYASAEKQGRYISSDVLPTIELFYAGNTKWWIPRGYLYYLMKWLKENNVERQVIDKTLVLKPIPFKFKGELRKYQKKAVKDILSYPVGVLEAGTGAGKTVVGIAIIAERKQPTLVIVHSKELLYQWRDQVKKFLDEDCGMVGDGKFEIKPITIGIINTVRNNIEELDGNFGQVIVDEAHRCTSTTWADTLQEFRAKHYLGLTATPFRRDGLGHAIFASIGPKKHKVDKQMLQDIGAIMKPTIVRVETGFGREFEYMQNGYSKTIKNLAEDNARNLKIAYQIRSDLKKYNQNVLVVSDRKNHCLLVHNTLLKIGIESTILTGSTGEKARKENVRAVKAGEIKVLIATTSLIGEGFDAPNLSALFLTTPIKFAGRLLQTAGRILRPSDGAEPRLYDFRDNNISALRYSGYGRDRAYKKEGWI